MLSDFATEVEREFPVVAVVVVAALVLVVSLIVAAGVCRVLRRNKLQDSATSDTSSGSGATIDTEAGQLLGGGGGGARADKSSTPVSGPAPHQLPRPRGGRGPGTAVSAVPPYTQYPQCR